ncbi:MAG TPA: VIT domain-containing protein [Planctomycetota bacterium]|nr:VIT domain-containing protein [Planctomycetota bacterium]
MLLTDGRHTGVTPGWLWGVVLTIGMCAGLGGRAEAAGLLIADGGNGGVLEIEEHTVAVVINNGVVVTTVTQVFRNTENRQVEALYTFPVPKGASVSNFSMWINGREMVGEVVEKARAREVYDSYRRVNRDPGLLEQTSYKTFEMRIFPIPANALQKVQIAYYQELDFDHDWATYVYPLATSARQPADARVKGKFGLSLEMKSEVPIVAVESPSHPKEFATARHTENYVQASLEATGGSLARDLVLACHLSRPRTGLDFVASRPAGEDGYFCLTLTPGEDLEPLDKGMDYVFILDVSGSMGTDGKLAMSRTSLGAFMKSLGDKDRFEVITFNLQPSTLFGRLAAPDAASLDKAVRHLGTMEARGGTTLNPAVSAAYRYSESGRVLNVVLLSDGLTEQAERAELLGLIRNRPQGSRVFCVGVGNEVNRPLLTQLAEDSGGLAAFISSGDDFERQARAFRRKLSYPVAANVKIAFAEGRVYDLAPERIPNLYHGQPIRLYGRYRGSGPVACNLSAEISGRDFRKSVELNLPEKDEGNPEIERMWAWHRIQDLLAEADRSGSRTPVLDQVIRLGEGYSIATEYTSFIVLENDAEFARWKIARRNATRLERDRQAQERVRAELGRLRQKSAQQLGPVEAAAPGGQGPAAPSAAAPAVSSAPGSPVASAPQRSRPSRGIDLHIGGGGGAIDPLTGGIALLLAALAAGTAAGGRRDRDGRRG